MPAGGQINLSAKKSNEWIEIRVSDEGEKASTPIFGVRYLTHFTRTKKMVSDWVYHSVRN